jgi:HflC protein
MTWSSPNSAARLPATISTPSSVPRGNHHGKRRPKRPRKGPEFGIEVVDVRIKRADLPQEVQVSVFQRMVAEREREAKRYRSEGEEESAKLSAETDKQRTIILADAQQAAQRLRGEGDASAARIYAEAYSQDAEFYSFTRSLTPTKRYSVNAPPSSCPPIPTCSNSWAAPARRRASLC